MGKPLTRGLSLTRRSYSLRTNLPGKLNLTYSTWGGIKLLIEGKYSAKFVFSYKPLRWKMRIKTVHIILVANASIRRADVSYQGWRENFINGG